MSKEEQIIEYATKMFEQMEETGIFLSPEDKQILVEPYLKKEGTVEEITQELLQGTIKFKEEYEQKVESISEPIEGLEFYQLPDMYHGITLNEQDIDLLNIVGASSPEQLRVVARTLTNMPTVLSNEVTYENLEEVKRDLFKKYQSYLIPKNEYFKDRSISLKAKLDTLFDSGLLLDEEKEIVTKIVNSSKSHEEMLNLLNAYFPKEYVNNMLIILRDRVPIEKSGILSSTYEQYVNLYNQLDKFNSLTIDDQFKYGSIVLQDGTQSYYHFEKCLKFAEEHNLKVRGNSLISYMGCPDDLYEKEPSKETHDKAYKDLDLYIKGMFSFLSRPEYQGRVRSIDIFNELLNRSGDEFTFRGDAPQDVPPAKLDDYKSGWYKHLSLDDIFTLIANNKPLIQGQHIDFMYNEVFLENPKKMEAFHQMMEKIQKFEKEHNTRIIDTLGIQLHTDYNITQEQLATMFRSMAKYGYPIEITEFDMTMPKEEIIGLTEEQIDRLKQQKMNKILRTINYLKDECKIKGFTIWSLNDKHNFVVSLENEQKIPNGEEPTTTLHGGYFTEDMTPRGERVALSYEKEPTLEKEEVRKLTLKRDIPKIDNSGFVSSLVIAIIIGGFLGIILAFAILNIK